MNGLEWVGVVMQLSGLLLAGYGLFVTWRDAAGESRFWPEWVRRRFRWLPASWRRPPIVRTISASDTFGGRASALVEVVPDPTQPVDLRVLALEQNLNHLRKALYEVGETLHDHGEKIESVRKRGERDLAGALAELRVTQSAGAVLQLRPAVWGLFVSAAGLVVQVIGVNLN
ncbi:hypothetical protein EV641_106164 [Rhodococcus sp. SMB37]|uniref:hypothetical protein n=1 Tax=Rhodococcus sp. SMB37 TaxID=2512213 RepID=UPI00104A4F9D|nr:hypothetical protein [Rhodococcus sp. SMB37]TCN53518.1 hypothetical protein EV641_106164 [Rhodococcus sp. SMB37]